MDSYKKRMDSLKDDGRCNHEGQTGRCRKQAAFRGFCPYHRSDADKKAILPCGCERIGTWKFCPYCGKKHEPTALLGHGVCIICGEQSEHQTGKYCKKHKKIGSNILTVMRNQIKDGKTVVTIDLKSL